MLPSDVRPGGQNSSTGIRRRFMLSRKGIVTPEAARQARAINDRRARREIYTEAEESPHLFPPWDSVPIDAMLPHQQVVAGARGRYCTINVQDGWAAVITHLGFFVIMDDETYYPEPWTNLAQATLWVNESPIEAYTNVDIPLGGGLAAVNDRAGVPADIPTPIGIISQPFKLPAPIVVRPRGSGNTIEWEFINGSLGNDLEFFGRIVGFRFPYRWGTGGPFREA